MSKNKVARKEEIHVLYALVDRTGNYSKLAGTSICSVWENTRENVTVHLFHDGSIKDKNEENFLSMAKKYGQKLLFYNVHDLLPDVWLEAKEIFADALKSAQYTEATMYRLVAPQILSKAIKRLIYIDADTLVHIDIKKLWNEKIGENGMAAVRESTLLEHYGLKAIGGSAEPMYNRMHGRVTLETCFNAGILLMDMNKMREMGNILLSGLRILAEYPQENKFYDQNILNYYFAKDLAPLPWYYNILQHWDRKHAQPSDREGIYHYMGKSLGMNSKDIRDTMYYEYYFKTPWFNGEKFCEVNTVMDAVYLQVIGPRLRAFRRIVSLLAVKKPVVLATEGCKQNAYKLLSSPDDFDRDDDKDDTNLLVADEKDYEEKMKKNNIVAEEKIYKLPKKVLFCSLGKIDALQINLPYDVDSHIYIVFAENYDIVKRLLIKAGLRENKHFVTGAFMLVGKQWLENLIVPNKFFEML